MHIHAHDVAVSTAAIPQMLGVHSSFLHAGSCHVHGDGEQMHIHGREVLILVLASCAALPHVKMIVISISVVIICGVNSRDCT